MVAVVKAGNLQEAMRLRFDTMTQFGILLMGYTGLHGGVLIILINPQHVTSLPIEKHQLRVIRQVSVALKRVLELQPVDRERRHR